MFVVALLQLLAGELQDQVVSVPHLIGHRQMVCPELHTLRSWNELEYMQYWMAVIARLTMTQAMQLFHSVAHDPSIDKTVFSDHRLDPETRWREYEKFVHVVVEFLSGLRHIQPVDSIIKLPDGETSLGTRAEQMVAEALDIPRLELAFNTHAADSEPLVSNEVFRVLYTLNKLNLAEDRSAPAVQVVRQG